MILLILSIGEILKIWRFPTVIGIERNKPYKVNHGRRWTISSCPPNPQFHPCFKPPGAERRLGILIGLGVGTENTPASPWHQKPKPSGRLGIFTGGSWVDSVDPNPYPIWGSADQTPGPDGSGNIESTRFIFSLWFVPLVRHEFQGGGAGASPRWFWCSTYP